MLPHFRKGSLYLLLFFLFSWTVFCLIWYFNDGRFGTTQLAAGTAAYFGGTLLLFIESAAFGKVPEASSNVPSPSRETEGKKKEDFANHSLATMTHWIDLVRDQPASILIAHDTFDPFCTCSADKCCGSLVPLYGKLRVLDMTSVFLIEFGMTWGLIFHTEFYTLGYRFWHTWWSAILCVGAIITCQEAELRMTPSAEGSRRSRTRTTR
jgi:hypothetical protein